MITMLVAGYIYTVSAEIARGEIIRGLVIKVIDEPTVS